MNRMDAMILRIGISTVLGLVGALLSAVTAHHLLEDGASLGTVISMSLNGMGMGASITLLAGTALGRRDDH